MALEVGDAVIGQLRPVGILVALRRAAWRTMRRVPRLRGGRGVCIFGLFTCFVSEHRAGVQQGCVEGQPTGGGTEGRARGARCLACCRLWFWSSQHFESDRLRAATLPQLT